MSDYNYRLEQGLYVLHDGNEPVGRPIEEVSLAIDLSTGSVIKHGEPRLVDEWLRDYRGRLFAVLPDVAKKLVLLTGRFELDVLNRAIASDGYGAKVLEMAHAGTLRHQPR